MKLDKVARVGWENMLSGAISEYLADWWWLIALAIVLVILRLAVDYSKRTKRTRRRAVSRRSFAARPRVVHRSDSSTREIGGKAYVTDGDGIRVAGRNVRLSGLDAPEWDQKAKHRDGYWFNHGKRVKSALIQEIGGQYVRVIVEGTDKFGRLLGTVTCNGRDIGEWLVREGHAIAAYDDRYKQVEREARTVKRGMWAHAHNFDPRAHRHRKPEQRRPNR